MENFDDTNIWRDVVGFEGYYKVSISGQVYSLPKTTIGGNGLRKLSGKILKPANKNGYLVVCLYNDASKKYVSIHRIVGQAFLKNPDNKPTINHINGDKADNRVENLEWVSQAENNKHAYDSGLVNTKSRNYSKGEARYNSKLTEQQVKEIRKEYRPRKVSQKKLAQKYGVSEIVIWSIIHNKIWTHI